MEESVKSVPPDTVDKLRKMLAYLDDIGNAEELRALTAWKAHTLTGDRNGTWSLSVTRNRRLTFRVDAAEREICDTLYPHEEPAPPRRFHPDGDHPA
jgi:toxin HigB-1